MKCICVSACVLLGVLSTSAFAQQAMQPSASPSYIMQTGSLSPQQQDMEKDIARNAKSYPAPDPATLPPPDASISVKQAAVECAVAQKVEQMGRERQFPTSAIDAVFMAGQCSGKVQTVMLMAQGQFPDCFPKISLEEGIGIFANWAKAHDDMASASYVTGMTAAFTETVPCMKR